MNIENTYIKLLEGESESTKTLHDITQIEISLGNKTIYFNPGEGSSISNKTVEGIRLAVDKRNDLQQKNLKSRSVSEEEYLNPCMAQGLKMKMSYKEMEDYMRITNWKTVNRVNVGQYARRLGYKVYRPMINGRIFHFYVNENIEDR
jgi:hypothetical protein